MTTTAAQDSAIVAQEQAIQDEIKLQQPLIGDVEPPLQLLDDYAQNDKPGFAKGVKDISARYKGLRRVRGDGNCFYRGFLFALLEKLLLGLREGDASVKAAHAELKRTIEGSKDLLLQMGYEEVAFGMFFDAMVDALNDLEGEQTKEGLEAEFKMEDGTSNWLVWFCRLLTSAFIKADADRFLPFIGDGLDVVSFCAREVEPMGRECEQVQIIALCEHLGVQVHIEYLDGDNFQGQLNAIDIPDAGSSTGLSSVSLLYRPGHYDILYTT
jgi:ubiquitin thioesterase protein OTUB1